MKFEELDKRWEVPSELDLSSCLECKLFSKENPGGGVAKSTLDMPFVCVIGINILITCQSLVNLAGLPRRPKDYQSSNLSTALLDDFKVLILVGK